ncbi:MAG: ParB N-terminal domain-containing protein [Eubacterium sp.]|jgi:ParB family chromosome partitioning protein|nr:ParB N-terminal domain-containing protein [Eubacterium sp.]
MAYPGNALASYISPDDEQNALPISCLVSYRDHPFELYKGERLDDLVESVRSLGVITPVIVRPLGNAKYEILSGHNRVNAAKIARLYEVPVVIKEDLSDEEAAVIVTESNLIQRSFSDLKHSERAIALKFHMEALKKKNGSQGRRSDIIKMVEPALNPLGYAENSTMCQVGTKLNNGEEAGEKYGLSKNTVARYIRLTYLTEELLYRVDDEEIPFMAGVALSYLSESEQQIVESVLFDEKYPFGLKMAERLRALSESRRGNSTEEEILSVFEGKSEKKKTIPQKSISIPGDCYNKYLSATPRKEIGAVIEKALNFYFSNIENADNHAEN